MRIILAGYNIDLDCLKHKESTLTPEIFSAAYARISRSSKPIPQLRAIARNEIKKAREQNRRIIFEMGHHSIAEHAVFNFDIIGISRFAVEHLEAHRLNSYTEASQRYIKLQSNFLIPDEIKKTKLLPLFLKTIKFQNQAYQYLTEKLKPLETKLAKAIEDARYVTPLATTTQLGMTINARNLELMIRRFASSNIAEINKLGKGLYNRVIKVAPSIILFYKPTEYDKNTYNELKKLILNIDKISTEKKSVKLVDYTPNSDDKLIASIIHRLTNLSYSQSITKVKKMSYAQKLNYIKTAFKFAEFYDATLREFEHCYLTFELIVSAACFGQLKRHRIATITAQDYDLNLGTTIPESIKQSQQIDLFNKVIADTEKTYTRIHKELPHIASYILTQAHRRRVLLTINVRELYHIARLRMDETAQWDIRQIVTEMVKQAKKVMPLSLLFCSAKDQYNNLKFELLNQ